MPINWPNVIADIDAEIDRLMQVRKLLLRGASFQTTGRRRKGKRTLSPEARAKIAAAQRKRWAQQRAK